MKPRVNGRVILGLGAARASCLLTMATLLMAAIPCGAAAAAPDYHLLKKVVLGGRGHGITSSAIAPPAAFTSRGAVT